jgi:hypothetical protein
MRQLASTAAVTGLRRESTSCGNQPLHMSETIASSIEPKVRLVWHRRDLRLLDNPLYSELTNNSNNTSLLSVYVFDESFFAPRPSTCNPQKWDAVTNGPHATRPLIQAVRELRKSIREMGGELLVRVEDPATIMPQVARQISATEMWWVEEPGFYEEQVSRSVRDHFLAMNRIKIVQKVGSTAQMICLGIQTNGRTSHIRNKIVEKAFDYLTLTGYRYC